MRKGLDEVKIRKEELEYGFLRGVKEMVRQKVEMGLMPWGRRVFYPKMVLRARPQKLRDFLIEEEVWELQEWSKDSLESNPERHHLYVCGGRYYMGLYFKSTRGRSIRRKISLGTRELEEAKERRDEFYKEWRGKGLKWYVADGAKWNMKLPGVPEVGELSKLDKRARKETEEAAVKALKEARESWKRRRWEQVRKEEYWEAEEKRSRSLRKWK